MVWAMKLHVQLVSRCPEGHHSYTWQFSQTIAQFISSLIYSDLDVNASVKAFHHDPEVLIPCQATCKDASSYRRRSLILLCDHHPRQTN
jgi:hypothetical protein